MCQCYDLCLRGQLEFEGCGQPLSQARAGFNVYYQFMQFCVKFSLTLNFIFKFPRYSVFVDWK